MNMYSVPRYVILDSSSDSTDSYTDHPHVMLPSIFTLMSTRGVDFHNQLIPINLDDPVSPPSAPQPQPKKRREGKRTLFSDAQRAVLMRWLKDHQSNPYPTSLQKQELMEKTGLNREQINVWFTNNRVRHGMSCSNHHSNKRSASSMFYNVSRV